VDKKFAFDRFNDCIDNASNLIEIAKKNYSVEGPFNVIYNILVQALEELGKASFICKKSLT